MQKRTSFAIGLSCAAALLITAIPANANPIRDKPTAQDPPDLERIILPFSGAVSLEDATWISDKQAEHPIGFRFDNGEIVGEYFPGNGQTESEFLSEFQDTFGTLPEVVGMIVERERALARDGSVREYTATDTDC